MTDRESVVIVADFEPRPRRFARKAFELVRSFFVHCHPPHGKLILRYPCQDKRKKLIKQPDLDTTHWRNEDSGARFVLRHRLARTSMNGMRAIADVPDDWESILVVSVPVNAADRTLDENYCFCVEDSVQGCEGLGLRIYMHVSISAVAESKHGVGDWVRDTMQILGAIPECYHAFVEVGAAEDTTAGLIYSGSGGGSIQRVFNQYLYGDAGTERKNYMRGVYWGNYFGAALYRRFDPDGSLTRYFDAAGRNDPAPVPSQYVLKTKSGGCFFAFSESPLTWTSVEDSAPNFGENWGLALWFHKRLREKQMLL